LADASIHVLFVLTRKCVPLILFLSSHPHGAHDAKFDTITALPTAHDTNAKVLQLTSASVQVEDTRKVYDWAAFSSAVTGYTGKHITLEDSRLGHAIIGFQPTVQDMVEMIVMFLSNDMAVPP
jgi:hypothetical protein